MKKLLVLVGLGLAGGVAVAAAAFLALPVLLGQAGGLWESLEVMTICRARDSELQERCLVLRDSIRAKRDIIDDLIDGKASLAETMGRFRQAMAISDEIASSRADEVVYRSILDWVHSALSNNQSQLQVVLRALDRERARLVAAGEYTI